MRAVLYWHTIAAIKMASLLRTFFCRHFVCHCPGGRRGNMERVVTRWRRPVASGVALDMPHQVMPSVLVRCIAVAIEMAGRWGAFVRHHCLFCIIIQSHKTMLWSIKTKDKLTQCLLLCLELVRILWAAAVDDGCRFGHHCCRQTSPNSIKHKFCKNILISTLI